MNPTASTGILVTPLPDRGTRYGLTEVTVTGERIQVITRIGPFRWTWERRLEAVRRLVLLWDDWRKRAVLVAVCAGSAPLVLFRGTVVYERFWALGLEIARRCTFARMGLGVAGRIAPRAPCDEHRFQSADSVRKPLPAVELVEETNAKLDERPVQHAYSRVKVTEDSEGMSFDIPPRVGPRAVLCALLTCFLAYAIRVAYLFGLHGATLGLVAPGEAASILNVLAQAAVQNPLLWVAVLVLGLVVAGRNGLHLRVAQRKLGADRIGPFGIKAWRWDGGELTSIATRTYWVDTSSPNSSSGYPQTDLTIRPLAGPEVTFAGLVCRKDWEWLATALRHALHLNNTGFASAR
jgi:hypothetical protein